VREDTRPVLSCHVWTFGQVYEIQQHREDFGFGKRIGSFTCDEDTLSEVLALLGLEGIIIRDGIGIL
jgi:hypothetical protein